MVLYIGVRNVDGVGTEKSDRIDLKEGSHLRDLQVCVERVSEQSIAGIGV